MPRGVSVHTYSATPSLLHKHRTSLSLYTSHLFTHTNAACVSPQTPYPQLPYQIGCHNVPKTRIMAALLLWFMTQIWRKEQAVLVSKSFGYDRALKYSPNVSLLSAQGSFWWRHTLSCWFLKLRPPPLSLLSYTLPSTSLLPSSLSLLSYCTLSILCSSVYSSSIM